MEGKGKDSQSQYELLKKAINSHNIEKGHAIDNSQQNGSVKPKVNGTISTSNFEKKPKPWGERRD